MIGYVMIGTNDLDQGARFYDVLLAPLGLVQVARVETYAAYAPKAAKDVTLLFSFFKLGKIWYLHSTLKLNRIFLANLIPDNLSFPIDFILYVSC